ncbi:MAG: hypothetical protein AUK47_05435 [Deltaproteobacteria bacterium CG2_30_63_29]|nr:MAG: hypothetical protein AUK47_05435 [Deltaproteobacteria bacterium CG2_30_63_29]PIW02530.1 MAG: hypothetical protein COW42_01195 [Deltaproteobacteria bacterium CG17_big_fil_post_rev_8_21_14_2_50_63_7]PJB33607.1 MAG: hypothetical protein CO108_30495 [Deltaproteobacteria bacterium CG_4_9_14_3_um_filter_63_12]
MKRSVMLLFTLLLLVSWAQAESEPYPDELYAALVRECVVTGATRQVCVCLVARMQTEVTVDRLMAGEFTEESIANWTKECVAITSFDGPANPPVDVSTEPVIALSCDGGGVANCKHIAGCFASCSDKPCMQSCLDNGSQKHCELFLQLLSCSQSCAGDLTCMESACSDEVRSSCRE